MNNLKTVSSLYVRKELTVEVKRFYWSARMPVESNPGNTLASLYSGIQLILSRFCGGVTVETLKRYSGSQLSVIQ